MTVPKGFVEAILAQPDDDAPRLVYADWLDEHGQPERAEFIRVQIERAALPKWDARQVGLRLRDERLTHQHGTEWRVDLYKIKGPAWGDYRRGFTATAALQTFADLGKKARAVWAATPLEAVRVRWPRKKDAAEAIPPIPGLRELTIAGTLVDVEDARRLAASPVLSTVRTLTISNASLGAEAFAILVRSPHLAHLTALRVPHNSIGNAGVRALVNGPKLPALAELDLSERGAYGRYGEDPIVDAEGAAALARWSGLARLHTLALSGNDLGPAGLAALLGSPNAVGLKHLSVRGNMLLSPAMTAFEGARPGLRLETLDVGDNNVRLTGVNHLIGADCLSDLKSLTLDQCDIGPAGARKLAKAPFLRGLRVLNLNYNTIGAQGLAALLKAQPPELHTLLLENNDVGDAGVAGLAAAPGSDSLRELDLNHNSLTVEAIRILGKSPHLKNLIALQLYGIWAAKSDWQAFQRSPVGKRLKNLLRPAPGGLFPANPLDDDGDIPF